jgi:hypothetical protein
VKFRVLSAAQIEMIQSALWYDDRQFGLADDFIDEVRTALLSIAENPEVMSPAQSQPAGRRFQLEYQAAQGRHGSCRRVPR